MILACVSGNFKNTSGAFWIFERRENLKYQINELAIVHKYVLVLVRVYRIALLIKYLKLWLTFAKVFLTSNQECWVQDRLVDCLLRYH